MLIAQMRVSDRRRFIVVECPHNAHPLFALLQDDLWQRIVQDVLACGFQRQEQPRVIWQQRDQNTLSNVEMV